MRKLIFFTEYMANDAFSDPAPPADSKNPIFIFCRFFGPGHLWGPGAGSVGFGGGTGQLSLLLLLGGVSLRAVSTPQPPPRN